MRYVLTAVLAASFGLSACNGGDPTLGAILGHDVVDGMPAPIPSAGPTDNPGSDNPAGGSSAALGDSCHSSNASKYCLSLKYVVYEGSQGNPIVSATQALSNLSQINSVWAQCNIAFEIGEFVSVDAPNYGLNFNTQTAGELETIRRKFVDAETLLVVTTGAWGGSLGAGSANAWTTMPGGGTYGVVLESSVGTYPNIIAHEIGHYLNLDHVADSSDVMNAIIYQGSTRLTSSQCSAARSAIQYYWRNMLR